MNVYMLTSLIAIGVFLFVLGGYFVIRYLYRNRRPKTDFKPSFVRADKDTVKDTEQLRGSGSLRERSGKQGRGRFYAFGVFMAAIFGSLIVRFWSLQILGYDYYVQQSSENKTRRVNLPANRGRILDRYGNVLVGNRASITVTGKRSLAEDSGLVHRLSLVLGIPKGIVRRNLLDDAQGTTSDHIIASDVPMESIAYIREHPTLFYGVNVDTRTVRYYPYGSLAAHILGYTGPVTEEFLQNQTGTEQEPYYSGDIIGKDGVEAAYEHLLQGMHGARDFEVDAFGDPTGEILSEAIPVNGDDVVLTIDANLQRETDKILAEIIHKVQDARGDKSCDAGALVCIDLEDGGILAASSFPTFYPADLTDGISIELWEELTSEEASSPLTNRVISGLYPAASTFKLFTSLAGLQHDMITDDTTVYCSGWWEAYGEQWGQRCWIYPNGHGEVGLEESINVSCDIFFYTLGDNFFRQWFAYQAEDNFIQDIKRPNPFQDYIATWGFGSLTGIDLPGEAMGHIPDAEWKFHTFSETPEDAMWNPGDMTNLSIGQGDLLVTPLQLCNGYATFARKKSIVPHVFSHVIDDEGNPVTVYTPVEAEIQPVYEQKYYDRVMEGIRRVIARTGGFEAIPAPVAGKSGTAEKAGLQDYSWFVGFVPADAPKYCCACIIEQGGGGTQIAMNGVVQTFSRIYNVDSGPIVIWENRNER